MKTKSSRIISSVLALLILISAYGVVFPFDTKAEEIPVSYNFDFSDSAVWEKFTDNNGNKLAVNTGYTDGFNITKNDNVPSVDSRTSKGGNKEFIAFTEIALKPNTEYTVLARIKQRGSTKGSSVKITGDGDALLGTVGDPETTKDGKYFYNGSFVTGANADKIKINLCVSLNCWTNFYVVSVFEASETIPDGDFESGKLPVWADFDLNSTYISDKEKSGEEKEVHSGRYAYKLAADKSLNNDRSWLLKLKKNTNYSFQCWIKSSTKATSVRVRSVDNGVTSSIGTTAPMLCPDVTVAPGDSWTKVSFDFNTGNNELVWLIFSVDANGVGIIDDILLSEKKAAESAVAALSQMYSFNFTDKNVWENFVDSNGSVLATNSGYSSGYNITVNDNVPSVDNRTSKGGTKEFNASTVIEVKPNTCYTVMARMKQRGTTAGGCIKILSSSDSLLKTVGDVTKTADGKYFYADSFTTGASDSKIKLVLSTALNCWTNFYSLAVFEASDSIPCGSFESGKEPDWAAFDTNTSGLASTSVESDKTNVHTGKYSFKLAADKSGNNDRSLLLKLKKNTDYIFNGWVKSTGNVSTVRVRNINNGVTSSVGSTATVVAPDVTVPAGEWTNVHFKFNSGENELAWFILSVNPSGVGYFDDLTLTEIKDEFSSDFEKGIDGWEQVVDDDPERLAASISATESHSGAKSLFLDGTSAQNEVEYFFTVKQNTMYFLNLFSKSTGNGGEILVTDINDTDYSDATSQAFNNTDWTATLLTFNTYKSDVVRIKIRQNVGGTSYVDDIKCSSDGGSVIIPDSKVTDLKSKRWIMNGGGKNLIPEGSFEKTPEEKTSWNIDSFIGSGIEVVSGNAQDGEKYLHVNLTGFDKKQERIMWINLEKNTKYVFSTYVRGEYLSDKNRADMTFGLIDALSKNYLPDGEMTAVCWDNEWHLIGCEFDSGNQEIIGIKITAKNSLCDFDQMIICKANDASVINWKKTPKTTMDITNDTAEKNGCDEKDNLIDCYNFKATDKSFWTEPKSYGQVVNIGDSYDHAGDVLLNRHSEGASWQKYIKWIEVKPETEYTLSYLSRFDSDGGNSLGIFDRYYNNVIELYQGETEKNWNNISFSFNTGDNDKIAIYLSDGGGMSAYTDFRLFESSKGKVIEVPDYSIKEAEKKDNSGVNEKSPGTGDRSLKTVLYLMFISVITLAILIPLGKRKYEI